MSLVRNIDDVEDNAFALLDVAFGSTDNQQVARKLIKGGRVFYPIHYRHHLAFVPSKFIGYRGNSVTQHEKVKQQEYRDGRETNEAIRKILGAPQEDVELENRLGEFCSLLGAELENHKHKFWRVETARRFAAPSESAINDVNIDAQENDDPEYRKRMSGHYVRDPIVRRMVLERANGKCEFCGSLGFLKPNRERYIECHHVILLSEQGTDTLENVIGLCPSHHRESHYGQNWKQLQDQFLLILKTLN